ncbi:MAG: YggS family pyridoxal phosphate-dependent enzyme [bacterium]|nr:YggS family pyridoxal phosphate-dependent enzyme [bacterium]
MIQENLMQVHARIAAACARCGRTPDKITLVAVSKTKPLSMIAECVKAGERIFGENYVQELTEKYAQCEYDVTWHMIGHLQRNKVKYIIDKTALIHSVDSLRLAAQIESEAAKKGLTVDILLEVNIAEEESKWGFTAAEAPGAVARIAADCPHVRVRGFMTSAPYTEDPESNRLHFRRLHDLFTEVQNDPPKAADGNPVCFDTLSMGMTGDYEVAIEEGATMVRVGTGIFGERSYA